MTVTWRKHFQCVLQNYLTRIFASKFFKYNLLHLIFFVQTFIIQYFTGQIIIEAQFFTMSLILV